jgi:hypothetical protein
MKVKDSIALHLRCIEADLRDYLDNPAEYRANNVHHIADVHTLLLDVMDRLGIPLTEGESE